MRISTFVYIVVLVAMAAYVIEYSEINIKDVISGKAVRVAKVKETSESTEKIVLQGFGLSQAQIQEIERLKKNDAGEFLVQTARQYFNNK